MAYDESPKPNKRSSSSTTLNPASRLGTTVYHHSDLYQQTKEFKNECISTPPLTILHTKFKQRLFEMPQKIRESLPKPEPIQRPKLFSLKNYYSYKHHQHHHHNHEHGHQSCSSHELQEGHDFCSSNKSSPKLDENGKNNYSHDCCHASNNNNNSSSNRSLVQVNTNVDKGKVIAQPTNCATNKTSPNCCNDCSCSSDFSDLDSEFDFDEKELDDFAYNELKRKQSHPNRLHPELWYNEKGELNDGPVCRCSINARKTGMRHGIYPGEEQVTPCDPYSNNADRLFHYSLHIDPQTNFTSDSPTKIEHNDKVYKFEGFSLLSHFPLQHSLPCKMIRFNIEYSIYLMPEEVPANFTVEGLDLFTTYLYTELLELYDLNWKADNDENGCPRFHLFPRFVNSDTERVKELLSMDLILAYLLDQMDLLINDSRLFNLKGMSREECVRFRRQYKDMIMWSPGKKPASIRVDQIDYEEEFPKISASTFPSNKSKGYPVIIHFGSRPTQLSYAGNPQYQRACKDLLKFRHLLANKPKVSSCDKQILAQKEDKLQEMKGKGDLKRNTTVVLPCDQFYTTGLLCDVVQHAMLMPVIFCQLRFHQSLDCLENIIGYSFNDKYLLQLALTHPSYRENYGTNPDHARNVLTNCGVRQPSYGDNRIHFQNTRKRGINMLINIMSRFGCNEETKSKVNHNERLEFLGDAVVEFLTSIHLYFMFPDLEEGGLATYRAALVQNQHLAILARKLQLDRFMLYAHGSDLCHDLELRHAMANCFEALMAALFLDSGIEIADKVLSNVLFGDDCELLKKWVYYPRHPLQQQDPNGDRHLIQGMPRLEKLVKFEELTGIEFKNIRLLARAFTHRSIGFNNLTLGTNQRMEYLGDTVLQLIASEYLYKFFPGHHEGHLSLLRSSLVNNRTQSVVCDDLGMADFAFVNYAKGELRTKDRADLLEAFIGALYVDKGLDFCRAFCSVCFFPRLRDFIIHQNWNDPKSKLQQCCLTLRSLDSCEPDIPCYKVIETIGPTNTRVYKVAVYFKDKRLATGSGPSIQEAEMAAAKSALDQSRELFPQLGYQRKILERLAF